MDNSNQSTGIFRTDATEEVVEQVEGQEGLDAAGAEEGKVEEADVKEEPKKKEEDSRFAAKFAALSRKEKALKQKEREIERRLKDIESKAAPKEELKTEQVEPLDKKIKRDPLNALKEMGLDLDTLVKLALNDGKLTPEMQMQLMREEIENGYKSKFQELEEKLTKKEQEELEAKKKREEEQHSKVIENFKNEIKEFVSGNVEQYEQIQLDEAHDLVYQLIEQHYNETSEIDEETGEILVPGKVLSIKEAADSVEEHLVELLDKRLSSSKAKKILESRLSKKEPQGTKQASVTLSNEQSQQTPTVGRKNVNREESLAEASKLIRWEE